MFLNCTKKICHILQWMFLEQRQGWNGSVETVNRLLTAETETKSVARIRAAVCNIAVMDFLSEGRLG
jgi:hypothetical protein